MSDEDLSNKLFSIWVVAALNSVLLFVLLIMELS
jgi:hypothetical protein